MPFNGMSPSGDVEADVVYANYGTPEDFEKLEKLKVDVRGKIVLVRYGQNFRGVKVFIAQEHGAARVIIYSDPADDGWRRGDKYPDGPWRPDTGVQRGSVGYMFEFPGDPTTPGVASLPSLPESQRISPEKSAQMPKIPVTPISYHDAWPILQHLGWPGFAARVAGRAAVHLSRRSGTGAGENAPQAGLSIPHASGMWSAACEEVKFPTSGWLRAIIVMPGSMARSIRTAGRRRCWRRARCGRIAEVGLETEAHSHFLQLGRRRRRADGFDRMGRATRSRTARTRPRTSMSTSRFRARSSARRPFRASSSFCAT